MAAEAVHLSALEDARTGLGLPGELVALLGDAEVYEAARLGAVIVDFPYFRSFPAAAMRYALHWPQAPSPWGDIFHRGRPVGFGRALLGEAGALRERGRLVASRRMLGLTLGYFSHLAVDTATHPFINRLAAARVSGLGGSEASQHRDVEKFQSILFHEARHGYDFMGHAHLRRYIAVRSELLTEDRDLREGFIRALSQSVGATLPLSELKAWARGYAQYGWLISSPVGKTLAPEAEKRAEAPRVYDGEGFSYPRLYDYAVTKVRRYLEVAWACSGGEGFDEQAVPEGSIDEPPLPADFSLEIPVQS